jgi:hypothetical protein
MGRWKEIKLEQTHRYVVEVPPVLGRDEWQRKYGQNSMLEPPENLEHDEPPRGLAPGRSA